MKRSFSKYSLFEDILSGAFMFIGVSLIFYGVIMRYIFKHPLYWVDEISTYVLVWGAIIGWSVAQRDERHIKVTLLYDKLPINVQRWVSVFSNTVSMLFTVFLAYLGILLVTKYYQSQQVSLNTQFPLWIVYFFVPIAAFMLGVRFIQELYKLFKNGGQDWMKQKAVEKEMGGMGHYGSGSAL